MIGLRSRVYLRGNPFITETLSAAEKQLVWHDVGTRERLARTSIGHSWSETQFGFSQIFGLAFAEYLLRPNWGQ